MLHLDSNPQASVVVADDNTFIRKILASQLRRHFVVKRAVADGKDLIAAALAELPDVIVSDLNMPVLGGVAAMLALRQLGLDIPFVMISADPDVAGECLAQGAAAFVCKARLREDLVPAVLAALSGGADDSATPPAPGAGGHEPGTHS